MTALPPSLAVLPHVEAPLGYLSEDGGEACYRVWPASSGRESESPAKTYRTCRIMDCRPIAAALDFERDGFLMRPQTSSFSEFFDDDRVRAAYYPEMEAYLRAVTGAAAVFVFDHNVRSAPRAANGQAGIRPPVDIVHGDYTEPSGAKRAREILAARGYDGPAPRRILLSNVWRPLHGPVLDLPLAICHAPSVATDDLVPTPIHHYVEDQLDQPRHSGEIFSVRHNPAHHWFYVSRMQPDEVLVFTGYDSDAGSHARFTPHTGFVHPDRPQEFRPRESIEVRAVIVDPGFGTAG